MDNSIRSSASRLLRERAEKIAVLADCLSDPYVAQVACELIDTSTREVVSRYPDPITTNKQLGDYMDALSALADEETPVA